MDKTIALPWYRSKVIVGAAVSGLTKLLVLSGVLHGLDIGGLHDQIVDFVVLGAGLIADGVALKARASQEHAPVITATKAQAEVLVEAAEVVAKHKARAVADDVVDTVLEGLEVPSWMAR